MCLECKSSFITKHLKNHLVRGKTIQVNSPKKLPVYLFHSHFPIGLQAWVGHPYYDVIDNTTDFEAKLTRMISVRIYHLY